MSFKEYNFKKYIYDALANLQFHVPTAIQTVIIPKALNNENVIGKSQTGTGKTHAFLLPLLQKLDEKGDYVQTVIVAPTRELAQQLFNETNKIICFSDVKIDCRLYVGGSDRESEIKRLEKSQPQIVIGTIGKINDLVNNVNILKIHTSSIVVIDEADMVFEEDLSEDIDKIFSKFKTEIQILIFSATISRNLITFLNKYLPKSDFVDLTNKNISKDTIEHIFIPTKNKDKKALLLNMLLNFHPYLALIFANTKETVNDLASYVKANGLHAAILTGDLQPRERKQILKRIKEGDYQYVIASDIAARGIDITGVSHVINYELPDDIEFYIHRTGRTARYESTGYALSLYDFDDSQYIAKLEKRNLKCVYKALKDGQLIDARELNARAKRTKPESDYEKKLHNKIPIGKKIKPGYKKKRKEEIARQVKKHRKSELRDMYIKKGRNQ